MTGKYERPELEQTLRSRLVRAVPPAPAVAGWAERAAASARKRRDRQRQALVAAGASCVVAGIAIVAAPFGENRDTSIPDTDRHAEVAATPQPPKKTRYVGLGSVAVVVPIAWDVRIGGCYDSAPKDAVIVPAYSWATCAGALPAVSLLRILPSDNANAPGLVEDARPAGEINGIRVLRSPNERAGERRWESALVVPDAEAIFWLEAPSPEAIDRVLATLTRLPDDQVALPSTQAPWPCVRDSLEDAGMRVEIREDPSSLLPPGDVIDSQPKLGTVARRGTHVTLTVPAGAPKPCQPRTSSGQ